MVAIVLGVGVSFATVARYAPVVADASLGQLAAFLPAVLAAGAAFGLLRAGGDRWIRERPYGRAAVWYLATAVVFGGSMYVSLADGPVTAPPTGSWWFTVANWAIGGSAVGLVLANYDLRRSHAIDLARANRRTADRLAQRLSVLNRVLRHDVRNKGNIVLGYAEAVERRGEGSDLYPQMQDAIEDLTRIADRGRLVQEMIETEPTVSVDLSDCVADAVADLRDAHPAADVSVDGTTRAIALTYPAVTTVVRECIGNAVEHNPMVDSDCRVAVDVRRVGDAVEVVIEDNGPGIPDRERRVLDAAVETPMEHSRGTSLWLARCVAEESGGNISIETLEDGGTRLALRLPAAEAA